MIHSTLTRSMTTATTSPASMAMLTRGLSLAPSAFPPFLGAPPNGRVVFVTALPPTPTPTPTPANEELSNEQLVASRRASVAGRAQAEMAAQLHELKEALAKKDRALAKHDEQVAALRLALESEENAHALLLQRVERVRDFMSAGQRKAAMANEQSGETSSATLSPMETKWQSHLVLSGLWREPADINIKRALMSQSRGQATLERASRSLPVPLRLPQPVANKSKSKTAATAAKNANIRPRRSQVESLPAPEAAAPQILQPPRQQLTRSRRLRSAPKAETKKTTMATATTTEKKVAVAAVDGRSRSPSAVNTMATPAKPTTKKSNNKKKTAAALAKEAMSVYEPAARWR